MDEPNTWDWTQVRWDDIIDTMGGTDITCTEVIEATEVERADGDIPTIQQ